MQYFQKNIFSINPWKFSYHKITPQNNNNNNNNNNNYCCRCLMIMKKEDEERAEGKKQEIELIHNRTWKNKRKIRRGQNERMESSKQSINWMAAIAMKRTECVVVCARFLRMPFWKWYDPCGKCCGVQSHQLPSIGWVQFNITFQPFKTSEKEKKKTTRKMKGGVFVSHVNHLTHFCIVKKQFNIHSNRKAF